MSTCIYLNLSIDIGNVDVYIKGLIGNLEGFMSNLRVIAYLLRRYSVKLSPVSVSRSGSNGSFSCEYQTISEVSNRREVLMYSVLKSYVHVNWFSKHHMVIFLHEIGHISQMHRASKHRLPEVQVKDTLFAEKRASVWALRVAKLLGKRTQHTNKYLDWAYGTYLAELIKGDPLKLANESYKAVKTFGVKYE